MILDKLKAYGFQLLALLLLVAVVGIGLRLQAAQLKLEKARAALSAEQASRATENSQRMQVALDDARETFRRVENHSRNQQEIADAHAAQEKRRIDRLAAAAADGQRLRDQVAAFAAACGGGEAYSPAAALERCSHRAATLGLLLGEADQLAQEFADAAEQHAGEIRTLQRIVSNDRALIAPGGLGLKP
jgi:hypothetical protein